MKGAQSLCFLVILVLVSVMALVPVATAQHRSGLVLREPYFPDKVITQAGLDRLSRSEQEVLQRHVMEMYHRILEETELAFSAKRYLESEGWEEIEYVGEREFDLLDGGHLETYSIFQDGVWEYVTDEVFGLRPGKYLAQPSHSSIELIDDSGDVQSIWVEDSR